MLFPQAAEAGPATARTDASLRLPLPRRCTCCPLSIWILDSSREMTLSVTFNCKQVTGVESSVGRAQAAQQFGG
ncbi:hypothetical protein CY34DRAFT_804211 [Suillus luteus UH-Slu-Lm8-n1]|uniref:Uncharacterized protein n=1 Tax=Suillus luteus UH-Slu-Lm8-n1 TaxID=930992 RepID=A0A0D0BIP8_9AGAM|nr:hypothetical protein CY34DRAFT_804211 [Suillus luteus UH-Slu-Lm8-n1]